MGKRRLTPLLLRLAVVPLWSAGQAMAHHLPPGMEDVDEFANEPFAAALTHPFFGAEHWLVALAVGLTVCSLSRKTASLRWAITGMATAGTALVILGFSV